MTETLPTALSQIVNFLEKIEKDLGVRYYLVGGILVNIYTVFRATQDIDFVVDIQSKNISIEYYISLLKQNNFFPFQDWTTATLLAKETNIIQYFDKREIVKFDNYLIDKFDATIVFFPQLYGNSDDIQLINKIIKMVDKKAICHPD